MLWTLIRDAPSFDHVALSSLFTPTATEAGLCCCQLAPYLPPHRSRCALLILLHPPPPCRQASLAVFPCLPASVTLLPPFLPALPALPRSFSLSISCLLDVARCC